MEYGAVIRTSQDGLFASSYAKCFVLHEIVVQYAVSEKEHHFYSSCPEFPLVFIAVTDGVAASLLSVEASGGGWLIRVLCTGACSLRIYRPIPYGKGDGYGLELFDENASRTYSSNFNVLSPKQVASMGVGSSLPRFDATAFSYQAVPVRFSSSNTDSWQYAGSYAVSEPVTSWVCRTESQLVSVCGMVTTTQCGYTTTCGYDWTGNYSCSSTFSCSPVSNYTCWMEFRDVQVCGYETSFVTYNYFVYALVRRTDWSVDRGAVVRNGVNFNFIWIRHSNGYYTDVVNTNVVTSTSQSVGQYGGSFTMLAPFIINDGQFSRNNTFPYTNQTFNALATIIME